MEDLAILSRRSPLPPPHLLLCLPPVPSQNGPPLRSAAFAVLPLPVPGEVPPPQQEGGSSYGHREWERTGRVLLGVHLQVPKRGSQRFLSGFGERLKRETGLDLGAAGAEVGRMVDTVGEVARKGRETADQVRLELVPRFVDWNKWERWKDVEEKVKHMFPVMLVDLVQTFQINLEEEGPLPVNNKLRYQPLDVFPAPLHRC